MVGRYPRHPYGGGSLNNILPLLRLLPLGDTSNDTLNFMAIHMRYEKSFSSFTKQGYRWHDFTERQVPLFRPRRYNDLESGSFDIPEYSADFNQAQAITAINEAGYQANPSDTGNYIGSQLIGTNWGISAPVLAAYLGRTPTANDMMSLPYSTALLIYKKNYWDALNLSSINSQDTAALIYDGAVNGGVAGIKKIVAPLLPSGFYNVAEINSYPDQQALFNNIKDARASFYESLGNTKFLSGWLDRLNKFTFSVIQSAEDAGSYVKTKVKNNLLPLAAIMGAALLVGITIAVIGSGNKTQLAAA